VLAALILTGGWILLRLCRSYDTLNEMASANADTLCYVAFELEGRRFGWAERALDEALITTSMVKEEEGLRGRYWESFDCSLAKLTMRPRNVHRRHLWIARDVRNLGQYRISIEDSLADILGKAGGPAIASDGSEHQLDYLDILLNKRDANGASAIRVFRRDWARKLSEFAPFDTIIYVEFVDSTRLPDGIRTQEDGNGTKAPNQPPLHDAPEPTD
jgi:hypothetical protein